MSDDDRQALARELGWTPEDEWDADKPPPKGGFKSAEEFLDTSPAIQKSQSKKIDQLTSKLDKMSKAYEQQQQDFRQMSEMVNRNHQAEVDALKRDLERKRAVAINEGDSEAAIAADREINALESQPRPGQGQIDPATQKAVDDWVEANQWYVSDPDLRGIADQIGQRIDREGVIPPGPARLAAVEAEVRRLHPDRLSSGSVTGGRPGSAEGARAPTGRTSGRTFDDLPQDAQEAYNRFKRLNPSLTKSAYLKSYEWD